MATLETGRLNLRKFTLKDASFMVTLMNSPGWLEFIGDRNIKTEEEAIAYLENGPIKSYGLHGFGLSMVELKPNNTPIGMCGLLKREYLDHPDIGFAFLPEHTGKGYAQEMVKANLIFAAKQLNIKTVLAIVLPANTRSIQLLEKVGMRFIKIFQISGREEELMLFSSE